MSLSRDIQRGLEEMEAACGVDGRTAQTFTWRGKEVPCTPSSLGRQVIPDAKGNLVEIDLTLIVRRTAFLTADSTLITVDSALYTVDNDTPTPVSGYLIPFRGGSYRIVTAKESGPKSHFELTLKDASSNE